MFASRTLATAERKYAQIEKEGLAVVFGVKKFHFYLFGRKFTIYSDHKPLQHLFSESRPVPSLASARIQRWALTLSAYNYVISHRAGTANSNADGLSRLPLPDIPTSIPLPGELVLLMDSLQDSPVSAVQMKQWTDHDPLLSRIRKCILQGWPDLVEEDFQLYYQKRTELTIQDGCILWASRVVVPTVGRSKVLEELHQGHPGVSRMKALARSIVWWPGLDAEIEDKVKSCFDCQSNQKSPAAAPLHPWGYPTRPWARLHVDHAGPFLGKQFLIVVDAYSKWLEAKPVPSVSSHTTISVLRSIFATHGLPETIVSNNGTAFTSMEFAEFTRRNGIRHRFTASYHPSFNGLAERAVQTMKTALKKATAADVETRLIRFLFQYRITPHSTTGVSPAELLMGRRPRSHLDCMYPSQGSKVFHKQMQQKAAHDQHTHFCKFEVSDLVFARNYFGANKWIPGTVTAIRGPLSYEVTLADGHVFRRHIDQLRQRTSETSLAPEQVDDWLPNPQSDQ